MNLHFALRVINYVVATFFVILGLVIITVILYVSGGKIEAVHLIILAIGAGMAIFAGYHIYKLVKRGEPSGTQMDIDFDGFGAG